MKYYARWTPQEHARLVALIALGKPYRECAIVLHRSHNAVAAHMRGINQHRIKPLPAPAPTSTIHRSDLVEWYLLGWRFVGFGNSGLCNLEWPCVSSPKYPAAQQLDARIAA